MIVIGSLTKEEIDHLIDRQYIARLGVYDQQKVYIVPITYSFDSKSSSIIGITGEGHKLKVLRKNPKVCIEIEKIEDITNWKTVIAWGDFEEITGADAKLLVHEFVKKVSAKVNNDSPGQAKFLSDITAAGTDPKVVVYKIHLKEKSGRFERS
jgi:hypothetical protein